MGGGAGGRGVVAPTFSSKCNVKHKTNVFSIPYPLCNISLTTRDPPKKFCTAAYVFANLHIIEVQIEGMYCTAQLLAQFCKTRRNSTEVVQPRFQDILMRINALVEGLNFWVES